MSWWRKLPGVPSIKSAVNWVLGRGQVPDGTRIDPEILDQSSKIEELHSQLEINEAIRAKKRAEIVNKHIESLEVTERQFQVFRNSNIQKLHEDNSIFEGISNEMVNSLSKGTTDWIGFGEKERRHLRDLMEAVISDAQRKTKELDSLLKKEVSSGVTNEIKAQLKSMRQQHARVKDTIMALEDKISNYEKHFKPWYESLSKIVSLISSLESKTLEHKEGYKQLIEKQKSQSAEDFEAEFEGRTPKQFYTREDRINHETSTKALYDLIDELSKFLVNANRSVREINSLNRRVFSEANRQIRLSRRFSKQLESLARKKICRFSKDDIKKFSSAWQEIQSGIQAEVDQHLSVVRQKYLDELENQTSEKNCVTAQSTSSYGRLHAELEKIRQNEAALQALLRHEAKDLSIIVGEMQGIQKEVEGIKKEEDKIQNDVEKVVTKVVKKRQRVGTTQDPVNKSEVSSIVNDMRLSPDATLREVLQKYVKPSIENSKGNNLSAGSASALKLVIELRKGKDLPQGLKDSIKEDYLKQWETGMGRKTKARSLEQHKRQLKKNTKQKREWDNYQRIALKKLRDRRALVIKRYSAYIRDAQLGKPLPRDWMLNETKVSSKSPTMFDSLY